MSKSPEFAKITFGDGEKVSATRDNTTLYNHFGELALWDHVFITKDAEEGIGGYVWAQQPPDNPAYIALAPLAVENGCELHLNIKAVPESDVESFNKAATKDLGDYLPDSWIE